METAILDDIARFLGLERNDLLERGVESLLHERRHKLLLDKLQILSRYGANSADEAEKRIKRGDLQEHPAWEDLITLENLDAELERLDAYIRSLQAAARSS